MDAKPRRERLRAVLSGTRCVHPGSVFDPISARIAEDLGFEVGMLGGSVASMVVLGAPDHFVLTLWELAEQVRRICRAGTLPVLVDADHGYGNALNVMRTVEELETTGLAGLTIEDTELPLVYGRSGEERLLTIGEGVGKMRAALRARQDPALVVVGRTSAPAITGIEDAIARCSAYQDAGVDALFVKGLRSRGELEAVAAAVRLPIILESGSRELADRDYLARIGVRIALQGHQPFAAAVAAVHSTLKALREGVAPAELPGLPPADFVRSATRDHQYRTWIGEFLGGS
jgi:carboxyvinyl-carboxyphosphonate phosphorylmutase